MSIREIKIAVVSRSVEQSPNMSSADDTIISAVFSKLKDHFKYVSLYREEEFISSKIEEEVVVNMCRRDDSIAKLQLLEDAGVLVVNSGYAIKNCTRRNIYTLFSRIKLLSIPDTYIVSTDSLCMPFCEEFKPCWLKLPDSPTLVREDINFVSDQREYEEALCLYKKRGIKEIMVSLHLCGDLVKFYYVDGCEFLHTVYPTLVGHSKFGYEENNDPIKSIPYKKERLLEICKAASNATGISVFGGDIIVSADGEPYIIDFNDWPSFYNCTDEAAESIVKMLNSKIREHFII